MINLSKVASIFLFFYFFDADVLANSRFSISGNLPVMYDEVDVILSSVNPSFKKLNTKVKQGRFYFLGEIKEEYEKVSLTVKSGNENLGWWSFFIKGGKMHIEILTLKGNSAENKIRFTNIPFVEESKKYDALLKPVQDSLRLASILLREASKKSEYHKDSLTAVVKAIRSNILNKKLEFIKTQQHSYFGLYLFDKDVVRYVPNELIIAPDSLMSIYFTFQKSLKETHLGKAIYEYLFAKQSIVLNNVMPVFSFTTDQGQEYNLLSFRDNKYILLCFWASWCSPCIKSIPSLKKLAKDYEAKGLQLISISGDDSELLWLKSLQKYNMPWLQTCDIPFYVKGPRIKSLYNLTYLPQYFLIDKEGKLIYHNVLSKDTEDYPLLHKKLATLLN